MDVAFVHNIVYPFVKGGAEKRIHEIGSRLADEGHDVTLYSRQWWDGPPTTSHHGMQLRSIGPPRTLYAEGDRRSIPGAFGFAARVLAPLYRNGKDHDIVVLAVAPYFHVFAARMALWRSEVPLVVTWHEVWDDYWDQYLDRFASGGKLIERAVARLPHHPIAVSEMTADRLARIGPSRDRINVIPNGIDVERIRTVEPATDGFDVLFAGRLIEDKNVDLVLEAFDAVARTHDATLGIIGDGPQMDALQSYADGLDSRDRITFLGFLEEYDDVLAHMRAATVFASPSVREGFGITLLEAMAADCVTITVDHRHSAGSDVVSDAGFVTEVSVDAIADAMDRALAGERPATDPVERAHRYDWDAIARREGELYRKIAFE